MASDAGAQKRPRVDDPEIGSPEAKRLRDDLFDILDGSDPDPAVQDLDSIMRSLEEEISAPASPVVEAQAEIGYLLEASDDELGLPPSSAAAGEVLDFGEDAVGFGDVWGFEEEAAAFGVAEFGDGGGGDGGEYLALDGLFDYSDVGYGSTEFSCRSESMPAQ
uniref:Uncharacterized protein n=1 Tax=Kalanchoe fedtschenkoi TaxID=63787 RepID=A0A7N0U1R1_KALFE